MVLIDSLVISIHKVWFHGDNTLSKGVLDLFFDLIDIVTLFLESLPGCCQQPLTPLIIIEKILCRWLIIIGLLVQAEVGQVNEHILHIPCMWLLVVFRAQSSQALVCQVGPDRVKAYYQHIQSQVELLVVQE